MTSNQIASTPFSIVEIIADEVVIKNTQDVLDIMGEFQSDAYIFHDHHFEPDFFDLSTRKLGEILQKFTNYRIKMAIIGNFDKYPSKTLHDFIYETNKFGDYLFVSSLDKVKQRWLSQ